MKKNLLVGVLFSNEESLIRIENILQNKARIRVVTYDEKRSGLDLLIIPDGVGLLPAPYLLPAFTCPRLLLAEQHQIIDWYINIMPVVGIGDGAGVLYQKLGEKVLNKPLRFELPKNPHIEFDTSNGIRFTYGSVYGSTDYNILSRIVKKVGNLLEQENEEKDDWE